MERDRGFEIFQIARFEFRQWADISISPSADAHGIRVLLQSDYKAGINYKYSDNTLYYFPSRRGFETAVQYLAGHTNPIYLQPDTWTVMIIGRP